MRVVYLLLFMAPQVLLYRYLWERLPNPTRPRQARIARAALTVVFVVLNVPWIFVAHRVLFDTVWGIGWIPFTGPWVAWQLLGWTFLALVCSTWPEGTLVGAWAGSSVWKLGDGSIR